MTKRDYFAEIQELRIRNPERKGSFDAMLYRLEPLQKVTNDLLKKRKLSSNDLELLRYVPVGAIACIEGYYKGLVRDLIDFGSPYRENIVNLREIKPTLEGLVGLHGGKATLGEFVSHFVGISNVEDIERYMSAILGTEFLKDLKTQTGLAEKVFSGVSRAFELRHIVVHELAPKARATAQQASEYVMWAFFLLMATERYLQGVLEHEESGA
ncbi:hypothetical protein FVQ98_18210 [Ottowia sp. GY511]|uniref:RiboL-PSP-HEPN domain-containing protein n=1 Tax=Ottowia flava TaxID=2675430 RepID=A0ABW4KTR2_9BURK|nr:hypothetical protein [Ottowia sp. GY511]TXK22438.1 hypothetical protein FVQ98_18210 [Ottowia sp. GY511]